MKRIVIACAFLLSTLLALPVSAAMELFFIHNDHLGTPRVITNQAQQVVWKGHVKPFGAMEVEIESITNHRRFPGQRFDIESRLHYNYFRDYDPTTGRYIQSDPIGLGGGINTYAYAANSPVIFTDPTGEIVPALICGASAIGGFLSADSLRKAQQDFDRLQRERECSEKSDTTPRGGDQNPALTELQGSLADLGATFGQNVPGASVTVATALAAARISKVAGPCSLLGVGLNAMIGNGDAARAADRLINRAVRGN